MALINLLAEAEVAGKGLNQWATAVLAKAIRAANPAPALRTNA
jgi:hypothetical protein